MKFTGLIVLVFLISCRPDAPEAIIDSIENTINLKNAIDKLEKSVNESEQRILELKIKPNDSQSILSNKSARLGDSLVNSL